MPATRAFSHDAFASDAFDVEFWDPELGLDENWVGSDDPATVWTPCIKQAEPWTDK